MVSRAEKFVRLGLSRNLKNIDSDDRPNDSVSVDSLNVTIGNLPLLPQNTAEIQLTNKLSQQITETIILIVNGTVRQRKSIDFASTETKTVTIDFRFVQRGDATVIASAGTEAKSKDVEISLI